MSIPSSEDTKTSNKHVPMGVSEYNPLQELPGSEDYELDGTNMIQPDLQNLSVKVSKIKLGNKLGNTPKDSISLTSNYVAKGIHPN